MFLGPSTGKEFLDLKHDVYKEKISKLDFVKIKSFCSVKDTVMRI